jgi:glucose 1-dehydrogenase
MPADHRFNGKTVLITGASRGIGRAVAARFAAEGASIIVNHFNDDDEAKEAVTFLQGVSAASGVAKSRHAALACDVADAGAARSMVTKVVADFGRLDVLINNAGIQIGPLAGVKFDAADFDRVLAVNLRSVAALSSRAIEHFLTRAGGGVVINTTSVHEAVPKPGYLSYAISKAGVGMLTRTLALEFADKQIRINAVGPGAIDTDMNAAWIDDPVKRGEVEKHIPMGRSAKPGDIAGVYAFLASEDARYITGQTIYACGGLTLYSDFKNGWSS